MKHLLKLILCCFVFQPCFTQNNADSNLNAIAERLVSNIISSDKEKVKIVTDRNIYYAGETVYFKAFLIDSIRNYLQTTPLKLFVDYVDNRDSIINELVLNNSTLQTIGRFVLPDSLPEKFYWLRAYTNEMIHGNLNNIGIVPIYVVNKNNVAAVGVTKTINQVQSSKPVLQLYPEGGSIISGLNSTVALSAKDNKGNPLLVSGLVKNNLDSIVATFSTNKYGLAKFAYFPKWFDKYTVSIKDNDHYEAAAALPKINFFAGQISVTQQSEDFITVRVALEDSIYSKNYITYLIAVSGDNLSFTGVGRGMYNITIPISKFTAGITTLYLFNNNGELLSSRDVYINKQNFHLAIQTDKTKYAARDKINISLKLTGANNLPQVGVFSLSVLDKTILDTCCNFFQNDTLQNLSSKDADLIMLTQTPNINALHFAQTTNGTYVDDTDFVLSGKVLNSQNKPVDNSILTILSSQANPIIETDTTDNNGRFNFELPVYNDSLLFTFQLTDIKGKLLNNDHVIFDAKPKIRFPTPVNLKATFLLSDSIQSIKSQLLKSDSLVSFTGKHWLKPVTVKGYVKPKVNYDESKRVSHMSQIFTRDMLGEGANMTSIMLLNNPGVRRLFFGPPMIAGDPLIVLDGVEIPKKEIIATAAAIGENPVLQFVDNIPVSTIDFIEVLTGPETAVYGMEGGHGVILINTKAGAENVPSGVALKNFYVKGFYNEKPFEMPDYADKQVLKSKLPDQRKTIYWNGNIVTNKNGAATVEFFAADPSTTYVCLINGITTNGDAIHKVFTISRN